MNVKNKEKKFAAHFHKVFRPRPLLVLILEKLA